MYIKLTVIALVLLGSLYKFILGIVQYRSANNPTPANVADVYDAETYGRWKKYNGEKCRLSIFSVAVSYVGKIKTAFQMVSIIGLLAIDPVQHQGWLLALCYLLLYVAAALTLWSMVIYLRAAWQVMRDPR